MRLLIAETHTPDQCTQMRPVYQELVAKKFEGAGVKVLHACVCRPERTYWIIVEADSHQQIEDFCRPREFMHTTITPVQSLID